MAGALVSAIRRIPVVLERSSTPQRQVVEAAEAFLGPGETYLAGTELLWRKPHMAHLSWLDKVRLADIKKEPHLALNELRQAPPRLVIDNYRVGLLPPAFHELLLQSFAGVGGNLWTYAPRLPDGVSKASYVYGGLYRVLAPPGGRLCIDGGPWLSAGDRVALDAGEHQAHVIGGARLASWSDDARFVEQTQRANVNLFERVYTY
jgi:hypothetical protein